MFDKLCQCIFKISQVLHEKTGVKFQQNDKQNYAWSEGNI